MLYNTGTIAINGNSATGTGTNWTAPASQVRAGQTIIVMSNPVQLFQISSVNSATSMTVTPAASPALSGQKYGILVSDIISVDGLAQAMSQLIKEYDENIGAWETFATTSASQDITVTINGARVTIPAIGKLATKTSEAVPVNQGGTGATSAEDARKNLGLGSAAILDAGPDIGKVMTVGVNSVGIGSVDSTGISSLNNYNRTDIPRGMYLGNPTGPGAPGSSGGAIALIMNGSYGFQLAKQNLYSALQYRECRASVFSDWWVLYSSGNTTRASDGTLKAASPVVKLFADGSAETNEESQGVTVTRQAVGEYLIKGCIGLNADAAWGGIDGGFDIPTDRNKQPLIWLDYEVHADGSVLVKTYHRVHAEAPAFARNELEGVNDGDPVDIPRDQFVSVRVEMPASSIWNQKQKQTEEALKQEQGS
ncbi:phage tail protein [Escherichia coli]|nr:phage tail protein [Escherichia coli]